MEGDAVSMAFGSLTNVELVGFRVFLILDCLKSFDDSSFMLRWLSFFDR